MGSTALCAAVEDVPVSVPVLLYIFAIWCVVAPVCAYADPGMFVGPPNLHEERPAEIQELVLLVVHRGVCLIWLEVVCRLLDWTHLQCRIGNVDMGGK